MNTEFKFYKQQEAYRANGSLMPVCENFPTHIFSSRKFHRDRLHGCLSQAYARVQYTRSTCVVKEIYTEGPRNETYDERKEFGYTYKRQRQFI